MTRHNDTPAVAAIRAYLIDKYGYCRITRGGQIHYRKSADKFPGGGTGWLYYCDIREADRVCNIYCPTANR